MSAPSTGPTVTGLVSAHALRRPASRAVLYRDRIWTFAELDALGRRIATGLSGLGVGAGDRVALWLPNTPAWIGIYLACARLGAIAVAVNTRFRSGEVADIVARSGAAVLVMWPGFRGIDFRAILDHADPAALDRLRTIVAYDEGEDMPGAGDGAPGRTAVNFDRLAGYPPAAFDHASPKAGSVLFTTSGTTRAPKLVLHDQFSVATHAREVAADFAMEARDAAMLQALPLCGVFGFSQAMASLAAGRPMALMSSFDGAQAAALVREHRVTHLNGTDDMYLAMLDARPETRPFPSLRLAGFAAFNRDPLELVAEGDRRGLPLVGLFGMSEVQALFARQRADDAATERAAAGGRPVSPTARVRVRDPETGAILGDGETGELEVSGPSRMVEYFGDPDATAEVLTADGFVRTGDYARLVAGGRFEFVARMDDALRLGGYLVSPVEIEARLEAHPGVAACQVVGAAVDGKPAAVAFVIPAAGHAIDEGELKRFCAATLARFKVPARVFALEAFPTVQSPNGAKIQRARLREMATTRSA